MTCARRASGTAPCATRRFTAVTWTGTCCDEAAIVVVFDADDAGAVAAGGARYPRTRERRGIPRAFDRILAHRIDRFGLSLENGRCRQSRHLPQHRESGLRAEAAGCGLYHRRSQEKGIRP